MKHLLYAAFVFGLIGCGAADTSEEDIKNLPGDSVQDSITDPSDEVDLLDPSFPMNQNLVAHHDELEEFQSDQIATSTRSIWDGDWVAVKLELKQQSSINQITFAGNYRVEQTASFPANPQLSYEIFELGENNLPTSSNIASANFAVEYEERTLGGGTYNATLESPIELNAGTYAFVLKSYDSSYFDLYVGVQSNSQLRYFSRDGVSREWEESTGRLLIRLAGTCIETCE